MHADARGRARPTRWPAPAGRRTAACRSAVGQRHPARHGTRRGHRSPSRAAGSRCRRRACLAEVVRVPGRGCMTPEEFRPCSELAVPQDREQLSLPRPLDTGSTIVSAAAAAIDRVHRVATLEQHAHAGLPRPAPARWRADIAGHQRAADWSDTGCSSRNSWRSRLDESFVSAYCSVRDRSAKGRAPTRRSGGSGRGMCGCRPGRATTASPDAPIGERHRPDAAGTDPSSPLPRIQRIAQPIPEQVERQHQQEDGRAPARWPSTAHCR